MGTVKLQQDSRVGLSCSIWEEKRALKNNFKMSADEIKKICDIYDWDGKGELDMYYFGDVMYAMGMNIMKSVCVKYGQTNDTGKKFVKFDEVVKLVGDATKEPNNSGDYKDYIELMKLYDKNENGTIMIAELETMLSLLGDEIPKQDVLNLLNELAPKEDEEGFIPYMPFLEKLCGKK